MGLYIACSALPGSETRNDVRSFKSHFGFSPPPDVTDIRTYSDGQGDSGWQYMRFRANPKTVARIVALDFKPGGSGELLSQTHAGDAPKWWKPIVNKQSRCYQNHNWPDTSFHGSHAYLLHDTVSGDVYFFWVGID